MGGAGRGGFLLPCSGSDFPDSGQDGHMGHSYCGTRHHEGGASKNGYCDFNSMCVSAGQGQNWGRITEKVTDYTRAAEMQFAQQSTLTEVSMKPIKQDPRIREQPRLVDIMTG